MFQKSPSKYEHLKPGIKTWKWRGYCLILTNKDYVIGRSKNGEKSRKIFSLMSKKVRYSGENYSREKFYKVLLSNYCSILILLKTLSLPYKRAVSQAAFLVIVQNSRKGILPSLNQGPALMTPVSEEGERWYCMNIAAISTPKWFGRFSRTFPRKGVLKIKLSSTIHLKR